MSASKIWVNRLASVSCEITAAGLAAKDENVPPPKREELEKAYADRAMDLLRRAVKDGFKDAKYLEITRDFDSVRLRDDFKMLAAELEKKNHTPGGRFRGRMLGLSFGAQELSQGQAS